MYVACFVNVFLSCKTCCNSLAMCSFGEMAWNITHYYYDTKTGFMHGNAKVGIWRCCGFESVKPGVHTNDFAPVYGRRAKKLGHASLVTGRLTFQPILRENLESPVLMYQPITTAVITDACLNTR